MDLWHIARAISKRGNYLFLIVLASVNDLINTNIAIENLFNEKHIHRLVHVGKIPDAELLLDYLANIATNNKYIKTRHKIKCLNLIPLMYSSAKC